MLELDGVAEESRKVAWRWTRDHLREILSELSNGGLGKLKGVALFFNFFSSFQEFS